MMGRITVVEGEKIFYRVFYRDGNSGISEKVTSLKEIDLEVDCLGVLCKNSWAIDAKDKVYYIHRIFENGYVDSSGEFFISLSAPTKAKDLFQKCLCLQVGQFQVCKGDRIITKHGEEIYIEEIFQNGKFGFRNDDPYSSIQRIHISTLGFKDFPCSDGQPCACADTY